MVILLGIFRHLMHVWCMKNPVFAYLGSSDERVGKFSVRECRNCIPKSSFSVELIHT